ncbi:MAG: ABC transporter ATP-binding protein/permease [Novosphingobium sp.]|nr:ABC transporter ATP-binding protein/permease [Novosphingobium sp.]
MIAVLRDLFPLLRANGLRPLAAALVLVVLQAVIQTLAVFSLIPLLSAAADMAAFRSSRIGAAFVALVGGGGDARVLIWAGAISLAVLVLGNLVTLAAEYGRGLYANRIAHRLRSSLVRALLARRYEYFTRINTSHLLKNLVEDPGDVASQLIAPALDVLARALLVVMLVGLVLAVEPWIVIGGGVVLTVYYFAVMRPVRRRAERASDAIRHDMRALYFETHQILSGIKPIIAADREEHFAERAERASQRVAETLPRFPMFAAIPRSGLEIIVFGGIIAWLLVVLVSGGNLVALLPRIGLVALVAYRLMPSLQMLFAQAGAMTAARQVLDEVLSLLDEQQRYAAAEPRAPQADVAVPLAWSREIRFDNVGFTYEGAEAPAIAEVSFTIPKGGHIAFVGPTGAGKSTLIDLILGLLQPTGGRILIDGEPLTAATLPAWRRTVGYVPQDLFLLDGTIAENIAFGWDRTELDSGRVEEVASLAQAREFIEDGRAHGFDAHVGERGVRLSGGQRQRLALARALYARPNILVMDEATSALDPATEAQVVAALGQSDERLTVITVTHRMSTVKGYDCIHYVEDGRIVASGDFAGLAERHPAFRAQSH